MRHEFATGIRTGGAGATYRPPGPAVPVAGPIHTQKAGISAGNELKAAILLAKDGLRRLVVRRAENQDRCAINFRDVGLHRLSPFAGPTLGGGRSRMTHRATASSKDHREQGSCRPRGARRDGAGVVQLQ